MASESCPCGAPFFPFYRSRGRRGVHEREKEKGREEEGPGPCRPSPPRGGPIGPVDDDGGGSTS
jgi:hypothetical protein